jgi:cytidylate kinase
LSRMPNIAIDGPAGSGKSTVARLVARRLGYLYVDTGAMYRAITYLALKTAIDLDDQDALGSLAEAAKFSIVHFCSSDDEALWCNGADVTPYLRNWDVTREVARVAAVSAVRHCLVRSQRVFARSGGVVMEGRDIGTVVLPDAEFKFFLTADLDIRIERRTLEMSGYGRAIDPGELRRQFIYRDEMDLKRTVGPLKTAPDAVVIEGTALAVDEIVDHIVSLCRGRVA